MNKYMLPKLRTVILTMILSVPNINYSQDVFKPILAPNAAELVKVNANEVGLFTGTPIISIPLESFEVDGHKISIGLNYSTGGIKVTQAATNVGLGWHLSGGGSVVRTTRGLPDETIQYDPYLGTLSPRYGWLHTLVDSQGNLKSARTVDIYNYYSASLSSGSQTSPSMDFKNKYRPFFGISQGYTNPKITDNEPDIFEFNFNGKSGKFIFDNNDGQISIHQVPWTGIKILYSTNTSSDGGYIDISSFMIIDTDNTKYYFEAPDFTVGLYQSREVSPAGIIYGSENITPRPHNSSWQLTKVVTPNTHIINYEYQQDTISIAYNTMQKMGKHYEGHYNATGVFNSSDGGISSVTTIANRLSKITAQEFRIQFLPEANKPITDRNRGKAIKEISSYNVSMGELKKRIVLEYDFSISDGINAAPTIEKGYYRRMVLKEIKEFSNDLQDHYSHKFFYNLQNFGGSNSDKLPHAKSFAVDLWGYYNGANQNAHYVPKMFVYPNLYQGSKRFQVEKLNNYVGTEYVFAGADRVPNGTFMSIGILNKIEYPTGGNTLYEFEPNQYSYMNENFIGPGVRIKKITLKDGSKEEMFNYDYNDDNGQTSGRIIAKPIMGRISSHYTHLLQNNFQYYESSLMRYSDSQAELSCVDSRLIGYSKVSELRSGNGKTVSRFSLNGILNNSSDIHVDDDGPCSHPHMVGYCDGLFLNPNVYNLSYGNHRLPVNLSAINGSSLK